ncbi:MAG: hypothetical protein ACKO4U_14450, partial [Caldilinea sp.]
LGHPGGILETPGWIVKKFGEHLFILVRPVNTVACAVDDASWDGTGYRIHRPYQDEEVLPEFFDDPAWSFEDAAGVPQRMQGPREFRHRLSTVVNGLASQQFRIVHCQELLADVPNPVPGSWEHYKQVTAWILELWAVYQP